MRFSTLALLLSLLVILQVQETISFNEHIELSHFMKKTIMHNVDIPLSQPPSPSPSSSYTKRVCDKLIKIKFLFHFLIFLAYFFLFRYIYTGELDLTKQSNENILDLLVASDELLLEELFRHVQDYLIKKQTKWVHENVVLVFNTVFRLDNCKKLQDYFLENLFSSKVFPLINGDHPSKRGGWAKKSNLRFHNN
jgi:hypothetical protein